MRAIDSARAFLELSRVKFLGGAALLYFLGVATAGYEGVEIDLATFISGLSSIWGVQLMTHYLNEYFDYETDRATPLRTPFSGGSGILPQGLLVRRVALLAASFSILVGALATLVLFATGKAGIYALAIFGLAAFIGYGYSTPPLRLISRGLGEVATVFIVSILVPVFGYYLQGGSVASTLILAISPLAFLQMAMLLRIHLPDYEPDRVTGKGTLVVRLGKQGAGRLHNLSLILGYLSAASGLAFGLPAPVALLFFLTLPLAAYNFLAMRNPIINDPRQLLFAPFWGVALFSLAAALELLGFATLQAR